MCVHIWVYLHTGVCVHVRVCVGSPDGCVDGSVSRCRGERKPSASMCAVGGVSARGWGLDTVCLGTCTHSPLDKS